MCIYVEFKLKPSSYIYSTSSINQCNNEPLVANWLILQNRLIYSIVILLLQKLLPPWYLLNTGGLYDSGFGFKKVSRLYGLYRHLYILTLCSVILYTNVNLLNKRFWIVNPNLQQRALITATYWWNMTKISRTYRYQCFHLLASYNTLIIYLTAIAPTSSSSFY